jgi:5'-3' exonuclease
MQNPGNLRPLIDGDILRYEVGFAAETGWKAITNGEGEVPAWSFVEEILLQRLAYINSVIGTEEPQTIFLTEGPTFRFELAKTKPYKGTRKENKPWHYANLSAYMKGTLNTVVVDTGIEADDALAIEHVSSNGTTVLCSRDKDLRQVPGWFFSWELGRQPSFGPHWITKEGSLEISENHLKLMGTGLSSFYSQVLTGDVVDNIPGLHGCGPVAAYHALSKTDNPEELFATVQSMYNNDELLLEQGRLCWMTRKLHEDGKPVLWELGMEE